MGVGCECGSVCGVGVVWECESGCGCERVFTGAWDVRVGVVGGVGGCCVLCVRCWVCGRGVVLGVLCVRVLGVSGCVCMCGCECDCGGEGVEVW